MRKTGAYRVYTQSNYNIGLVMHLLNHSSEAMTLTYLGLDLDKKHSELLTYEHTIGTLFDRVGTIFVRSSDNILINNFVNIEAVGMYANYLLVINNVQSIIWTTLTSIVSNIGVKLSDHSVKTSEKEDMFYKYFSMNYLLSFILGIGLTFNMNGFIQLWLGKQFLFPFLTTILIGINFFIQGVRTTSLLFINALGLNWFQKYKAIVESILNILLSVFFAKYLSLGINGILIGTISSTIIVPLFFEPYTVIHNGISSGFRKYLKINMFFILVSIIGFLGIFLLKAQVPSIFSVQNVGDFVILMLYSMIYAILFTSIFFLNKVTRKAFFR